MPINYFLAKTDPDTFSIEDFEKEKITKWDGVHNYQALQFIRSWKIGDVVFIYYSQIKTPAIVGIAKVVSAPEKDLDDKRGISWFANLELVKILDPKDWITLESIKQNGSFSDFLLVRNPRLSVMICPENFVEWVHSASGLSV